MSVTMDDSIKRWTAKRKTALVVEIIQGKTTVAEVTGDRETADLLRAAGVTHAQGFYLGRPGPLLLRDVVALAPAHSLGT